MAKIKTPQVFKTYIQEQNLLLPPSLSELIATTHMVRVVDRMVEEMDLSNLIALYEGGGASAYHPKMLLKVLLYAYTVKVYTGRKIAKALTQDIHFMWLSGMTRPDFRTINLFRSSKAKEVIEILFKEMLEFLMDHKYIKMENYFCDGSTFSANANKHKMVWKKNAERFHHIAEEKCKKLFEEIENLNALEDKCYGKDDLEENGGSSVITKEAISEKVNKLNERIRTAVAARPRLKAEQLKKKLEEASGKVDKYQDQIKNAGKRSGYNKTDKEASAMMMKNKVEVLPAYNVMAGCEDQFITGVSVHQNPNDSVCFEEHLQQCASQQPVQPNNIIGDAGFGTEQNYELLEQLGIEGYLKFSSFHAQEKKGYSNKIFLKENFPYDPQTDTYKCPNDQILAFSRDMESIHKRTGYKSLFKEYECTNCAGCPFYQSCCKSTSGANRTIQINDKLEKYKQKAREKLKSQSGLKLRKQRSIEIETCFADIKHNMGFRRFHLRGLKKVKTEFALIAMAHNLKKVYLKELKKAS